MASITSLTVIAIFGCLLLQYSYGKECPEGWAGPYRGVCYGLSQQKLSWFEANTVGCENLATGAYLASVTHSNKAYLSKQGQIINADYMWLGLRSGDTKWNEGTDVAEEVNYRGWETVRFSEPSGSAHSNDDCVLLFGEAVPVEFQPAGGWIDWPCEDPSVALCELNQGSEVECPKDWTKYTGICYLLSEETMTFDEAEKFCATQHSNSTLAAVPDYAGLTSAMTLDAAYIWIGLRSTPDNEGNLRWLNAEGAVVTQTNWNFISIDEPNGPDTGPDNDCVMGNGKKAEELFAVGEWGDYDCNYKSQFLCAVRI